MPDEQKVRKILETWSETHPIPDSALLTNVWAQSHNASFLDAGVPDLIFRLRDAFAAEPGRRRVLFLQASDFNGHGYRISSVIDLLRFILFDTRRRLEKVMTDWGALSSADFEDSTVRVCTLWAKHHATPCSAGVELLVPAIAAEFREVNVNLSPEDFSSDGAIQSEDDLIKALSALPPRERALTSGRNAG